MQCGMTHAVTAHVLLLLLLLLLCCRQAAL
jgi:hypothetical protein